MSLTHDDLAAISELTTQLLEPLKEDMQGMKEDMQGMKEDMQGMKEDIHRIDDTTQDLSGKVTDLQLHIENETDRNIQVLAENHLMLIDKLNKAIDVQSKELVFEVEISSLKSRVSRLEERARDTARPA